jgi:uncharacterized membrane protein YwzB
MNKKFTTLLSFGLVLVSVGVFFSADTVLSQVITGSVSTEATKQLNSAGALTASDARTLAQDPRVIAAVVIRYFLSLLGTILLVLIVLSGYWYFTARGDDEKIARAKTTIKQALMGMVIILLAYSIATSIINSLTTTLKAGEDNDQPRDQLRLDWDGGPVIVN